MGQTGIGQRFRSFQIKTTTAPETLRATIALIGRGIRDGARYIPIRQHAAQLASRAGPKDYLGQLRTIFDDFVSKRWRYVHDPNRVELLAISGPVIFGQIMGFDSVAPSRGYGDCDDATVAVGALAESIGLQSRIVTIAPLRSRQLFSHVFPQIKIPKVGWISADAVGFPKHPLGWTPPHERIAIWDTRGNLLDARGQFPPAYKRAFKQMLLTDVSGLEGFEEKEGGREMSLAGMSFDDFEDFGLDVFGLAGTDNAEPEDWAQYGLKEFGAYLDTPLPMIGGDRLGLMMEYDETDEVGYLQDGSPLVRTKMLEIDPDELRYIYRTGRPRPGTVALGDDGDVYQWVEGPLGGFFKKLFKKIGRGVKKVAKGIKKGVSKVVKGAVKIGKKVVKGIGKVAKSLIKKLPGGKYLVKVFDKIKRVAMKVAKPLVKILGKIGKKIAPIAALIPGYGPVISAALHKAGDIAKLLTKHGVITDKKGRPRFKSGQQAKAFQEDLKRAARQKAQKRRRRRARRIGERGVARRARVIRRGSPRHRQRMGLYGLDDYSGFDGYAGY